METTEVLAPEEIAQKLFEAIETARAKLLVKLKRKRKKLVKFVESIEENFEDLARIWSKSFIAASVAAGIFLTSALPITAASVPQIASQIQRAPPTVEEKEILKRQILEYLEKFATNKKINSQLLASLVSQITSIQVKTTIDDNKLPDVFGEIATEKHLQIYPGETLQDHLKNGEDFAKFSWTGISTTPAAWGYFAKNKNLTTDELVEKEKYYLAIQTFAVPDWSKEWPELKEWYKFRKLLVYNPENGKAVVGVLADAGPATFTGRAFGGSPEVMDNLGLAATTMGDVLVFFLDDRQNLIPLGPVNQ